MILCDPGAPPARERLNSWKAIAAYLGRDIRTVSRWEATEGLPVRRLLHDKAVSVYALRDELDAWMASRTEPSARQLPVEKHNRRVLYAALVIGAVAGAAGLVQWLAPFAAETWTVRPLQADSGQALEAALSPDGKEVAYSWNGLNEDNFDIYVRLVAGGPPLRLTSDPANEYSPAWSPDGARIAFLRTTAVGRARIVIMSALGGWEKAWNEILTQVWPVGFAPGPHLTWSPDGKWLIVAARLAEGKVLRLMRVAPDSGEMSPLTDSVAPDRGDTGGAVSPDGRLLAYSHHVSWGNADLYILPLTKDCLPAGGPRRLETGAQWNVSPVWLPDNRRILISHGTLFGPRLVTVPARGGAVSPVPGLNESAWYPSVARSSQTRADLIVYTQRVEVANLWRQEIPRENGAAPAQKLRIVSSTRRDYNPQYSPDGRRIAFTSDRTGRPEIWVCDSEGRNAVRWTDSPGLTIGGPEWSPDGRQIVYAADGKRQMSLLAVTGPGAAPKLLYATGSSIWGLTWPAGGDWIYFASDATWPAQVWKIQASGGTPVAVTDRDGAKALAFSPDLARRFLIRDGPEGERLWEAPASGGDLSLLLESFGHAEFRPAGFYFNSYRSGDDYRVPTCLFYRKYGSDFARPLFCLDTGIRFRFAVSPDERFVVYSRPEFEAANLMLAEGSKAGARRSSNP